MEDGLRALDEEIERLRTDPIYAARVASEAASEGGIPVTAPRWISGPDPKGVLKAFMACGFGFAAAVLLLGWLRAGKAT